MRHFDNTALWLVGSWDSVNQFNHTSLVGIVTPTDRPQSVRNRCVIEVFGGVFVLSRCFLDFCGCRGFCHRTESGLFLFLLVGLFLYFNIFVSVTDGGPYVPTNLIRFYGRHKLIRYCFENIKINHVSSRLKL